MPPCNLQQDTVIVSTFYAKNNLYLNIFLKDTLIQLCQNTETEIYLKEQFCTMAQKSESLTPLITVASHFFYKQKVNS